ncbi:HD domain-containing phosphohydrolase [Candidatus Contubernalis alkaliaceticus]|uniref:HD domain-containing phosphohydrolase n=1 Tax=Candidatus Contubernalis alkaliaceticus TaxID=338645 RepID=UPI001F4C05A1|nr:HD domain-containing phosphohydrolase [Candidatus Contubernalis alkalaceticus]UNC92394.1 diguanylate cyclase [Candidatus Contubernalis alkalaceticus]
MKSMTLRLRTLAVLGSLHIVLVLVIYMLFHTIMMNSVIQLEKQYVQEHIERAIRLIEEEIYLMSMIAEDWAPWDDTYHFVNYLNQDYITKNDPAASLINLQSNVMAIINTSGEIVYAVNIDLVSGEQLSISRDLKKQFEDSLLVSNFDSDFLVQGIILIEEGIMVIGSHPILTNDYQGPSRGNLVMGRFLDSERVSLIGKKINLDLLLLPLDQLQEEKFNLISEDKPILVKELNNDFVSGHAVLKDIYNKPVVGLLINLPRDIFNIGRDAMKYMLYSLIAVGLIFTFGALLFLEKNVLSRLVSLSQAVSKIGDASTSTETLQSDERFDELSFVSHEIKNMLSKLHDSQQIVIENEKRFRALVTNVPGAIFRRANYSHGTMEYMSDTIKEISGYPTSDFFDFEVQAYPHIIYPEDRMRIDQVIQEHLFLKKPYTVRYRIKDINGDIKWVQENGQGVFDKGGKLQYIDGIIIDINDSKQAEEKIRYMSFHDCLTGLYNRAYLEQEMQRLDTKRQLPISIIMGDLNGLKLVNDTYGHCVGDEMLVSTAEILKKTCREEDIVARWSGDEFVILLPQTTKEEASLMCKRINNLCSNTYVRKLPFSIALGVASKKSMGKDLVETIKEAEDNMYKHKLAESRSTKSAVLNALLKTLEEKSCETEEHARRMQEIAMKIGEKINLPETELDRLTLLVYLHDIGKITVPEEILIKKKKLTEREWEHIKKHPETGYRIARSMEEFAHVAEDILSHHEHWDGSGYPQGLKGKEIPLLARIASIADAYEVMTHGRPYKEPISQQEVIAELKRCAGTHFDPDLVEILVSYIEERKNENVFRKR